MRKLRKTVALFLALAMTLSMGALAADNKEEEQGSRLWTRWVGQDEKGRPFVVDNNGWYDPGMSCPPGEYRYVVFYTADKWDEEDGQPISKLEPVKLEDLTASEGLTLTPWGEGAPDNDRLKDCYVELSVAEFDKEYTVSYNGAEYTVISELPDIALYSGPERTTENYMLNNEFIYTAGHMDDVCYILSETDIERYGRVVDSLALSENDEDTINDMVTLEKVSDSVYSIRLKDGAEPYTAEIPRVRFTITWKYMDGNTEEDDSYEIWVWDRAIVMAGEESVLDGTKEFPNRDEKPYNDVADKLSDTVTMTAGEDKTVYLSTVVLRYSDEQEKAVWVANVLPSNLYFTSDAALTLTVDSDDYAKFTLACDEPGEYEIALARSFACYYLDENGDPIYDEAKEAEIEDELMELWGESWGIVPALNGEDLIFWDFENGKELESPYDAIIGSSENTADEYVLPLKVIVEDGTPITEVYSDVPEGQWYVDSVAFVTSKKMMNGSNGKFNPNSSITGAEFVQILYNIADRPAPAEDAAFEGVSDKDWYADAVLWAAGEGLISDTGDNALDPTAPLSREQMFDILYKSVGGGEKAEADLSVFTDTEEISAWALDAVNWAVKNNVTSGVGNGKFAPADATNRAGVAAMLMKYYSK